MSQNFLADAARAAAYEQLLADVFDYVPARPHAADPYWEVLAYFAADGACVAGIEVGEFPLALDGVAGKAMAIRLACVAPAHRGRGLFRKLVEGALRLGDARASGAPTLLYTEDAALYTRFGFVPLAQHAFVGAPPTAATLAPARPLDPAEARPLIDRLAPIRAPVSLQCAVRGAADLLQANLDDEDLRISVLDGLDALVVYEMDAGELVVVDIVAEKLPTMAEIVAALGAGTRRVRTLFPPDRLEWHGVPEQDETGLMIRGPVPPAMRRPFMLPPTTSF